MLNIQKGFTLTELMVVTCILGVLFSMSFSGSGIIPNNQASNIVIDLQNAILYAKSESVKTKKTVKLMPTGSAWESGWKVVVVEADGTETLLRQFDPLPNSVKLYSNEFSQSNPATFYPTGILSRTGFFKLALLKGEVENVVKEVGVLISGQVRIKNV